MTGRHLPDRRQNLTQRVSIGTAKVYITLGFFDDELTDVGEIFISLEKTGSERRWLMDEVARLASKLLQHGCPLDVIAESWLGTKGKTCGPVQGDARIKNCTSILDYVARMLLVTYYQRDDLAHVKEAK
jgi:ribonucleoside-diphosphate reductase alpha chain